MPAIRTFIAVELTDAAHTILAEVQNRLKAAVPAHTVRWTAPENIHLTLHFLGDTPTDDIKKISDLMTEVAATCRPFSVNLGDLGCFPHTRRPRIVWVGVSGQLDQLVKLYDDLGRRLKTIGFTPEARPFSPHLTIGRVKDGLPSPKLAQLGQTLERAQPNVGHLTTLAVAEISLMQSNLQPTGAVYTPLVHVRLGKST
jgi:2'-5' RNA ligase